MGITLLQRFRLGPLSFLISLPATTEDEMVGWHHQINGHEFEQALVDGEGQGGLAHCSPWSHKQLTRLSN